MQTRQLFRFAVSTLVSAAVTIGVPFLLHQFAGAGQRSAVAISQTCAFFVNFLMIRMFVFGSNRAPARDFLYYLASAAGFRGAEYLCFLVLFDFGKLNYLVALILTLCASTVFKFVWYRYLSGPNTQRLA